MKPTLTKHKDPRGRVKGHVATIGPIAIEGPTPSLAATKCSEEVLAALVRLDRGPRVLRWKGHVVIVAPMLDGWGYWFGGAAGSSSVGLFQTVRGEREDAEDHALHHLAQNLWSPEVNDTTFLLGLPIKVQKELLDWIRWQRDYARLRAEGKTDQEAHAEARSA